VLQKNEVIKSYQITATLITQYSKEVVFDSNDTNIWYQYDEQAAKTSKSWDELSCKRQEKILQAFEADLENLSIDPEGDPEVSEDCKDWVEDVWVSEI